ncbi:hypothetical protein SAY86_013079 [Trapa natans]|uniref:Uncharacterized protein n=1 Tax=Trapa natans TaxID=22666 RepID=A0AAN7MDY0_TRANT|nr:hypothetical protein SAY86_013079 [Trapa natans]
MVQQGLMQDVRSPVDQKHLSKSMSIVSFGSNGILTYSVVDSDTPGPSCSVMHINVAEAEVGAGRYELLLWLQLSYCTEIHPEPSCAHGFIEVKAACCGPGDLNAKLHACLFHSIASTGDITYSGICTTH